jgi:hypothetical protein
VSEPLRISAVDITGYILLGRKKLNIRVTLDDDSTQIVNGSENESESGDERPAEENHDHDELAIEDGDQLADDEGEQLADDEDDQLADDEDEEADDSELESRAGGADQVERRDGGDPEGDDQGAGAGVSGLSKLLHPRARRRPGQGTRGYPAAGR